MYQLHIVFISQYKTLRAWEQNRRKERKEVCCASKVFIASLSESNPEESSTLYIIVRQDYPLRPLIIPVHTLYSCVKTSDPALFLSISLGLILRQSHAVCIDAHDTVLPFIAHHFFSCICLLLSGQFHASSIDADDTVFPIFRKHFFSRIRSRK